MTISIISIFLFINITRASIFTKIWSRALKQTLFEQEVEDVNAIHKIDNHLVRRLIVMVKYKNQIY